MTNPLMEIIVNEDGSEVPVRQVVPLAEVLALLGGHLAIPVSQMQLDVVYEAVASDQGEGFVFLVFERVLYIEPSSAKALTDLVAAIDPYVAYHLRQYLPEETGDATTS